MQATRMRTTRIHGLAGAIATMFLVVHPARTQTAEQSQAQSQPTCSRHCLYEVLDAYLAALKAQAPERAPWARGARYTENNVELAPGKGMWRTVSALESYDFRFADPSSGEVAFYGVVDETVAASPFAVRLKVARGRITEAETIIARPQEAGVPFVKSKLTARPEMNEILAPNDRTPRAKMIAIANGYFDTLQRNDGTLHTAFEDDCNRREDGMQTTNNPNREYPNMSLGCAAQFKLGIYRYDDELRARRFALVDEERGIVLAGGFIDHSGRLGEYTLTDGRKATSKYRHPHSFCLLEAFKIRSGKIQAIEAVFTTVPYGMASPWVITGP
jgi:hypothetical protein